MNQIGRTRSSATTRKTTTTRATTTTTTTPEPTTTTRTTTTAAPTTEPSTTTTTEKYVPEVRKETWTIREPSTEAPTGSAFDMQMEKQAENESQPSSNSEIFDGPDSPPVPQPVEETIESRTINNPKRHTSIQSVEEPGIFGAIPKYMLEEGKGEVNETEEMIKKEYREVMRRLRKGGSEPKGPNPYMPNHLPEGSNYRQTSDRQGLDQPTPVYTGQNDLSSPVPIPEPATVRVAPPYDYPISSRGSYDQNYVDPNGQRPGWTMEPVPEEHFSLQESTRHLYVDPNHDALKPRKVIVHQETSDHPSPWMFPAKDEELNEGTKNRDSTDTVTNEVTTEAGPKWVMASSTTDPLLSEGRRPISAETGSAFDMDSKMSTTEASTTTVTASSSSSDPIASNTIDGSSPSSPSNEQSSRNLVEGPIFREFIDGEMGLDGRCRCFVDPSVYFRR